MKKRALTDDTLFSTAAKKAAAPLADQLRPSSLADVVGQEHLLAKGKLLAETIAADRVPSLILWGPPGSGKTTLAHVISRATQAEFVPFSAVLGGVPELREILTAAKERLAFQGRRTILFVDEIHRFNKGQQDAFLPHVEAGTVTLVGATTENPSFAVNAAVLSRCKIFRLEALSHADVRTILDRALPRLDGLRAREEFTGSQRAQRVAGTEGRRPRPGLSADSDALDAIAHSASGDARRALGALEACAGFGERITLDVVLRAREERTLLYDKSGDEHYDVTSALIKSMRGSDPDAALYWLMRMLDAGDDPLFVLRRLIIFASEDIGNADPRALSVAVDADAAFRRLGMPEGLFAIAHACLYLASCPKSNAVLRAIGAARGVIAERGALPVPKKLRNAPTPLAKEMGHGADYRYAHDFEGGVVPGETYLPDDLVGTRLYAPSDQGLEKSIAERLEKLVSERDTSQKLTAKASQNAKK